MIKNIIPRNKYILVKPDEEPSRESAHGIITPTSVEQEKPSYGTVLAVGSEIKDIKVKDRVVYGKYAGDILESEEGGKKVEYKLLPDEDVIAFIKQK